MRFLEPRKATTLFIALVVAFAFSAVSVNAQQPTRISGKITAAYTYQDSIIVGDAMGHKMSLAISEGKNVNTGEHVFLDGAQVVNMGYSDLVQGNGTNQGYVKFTKDGDTTVAEWEGKVTTTPTSEGTPVTIIKGTFSYIKGTGQFENIKGNGTYRGEFTSKTEYYVEWQGGYSIKK